jgi:hypothetical protein
MLIKESQQKINTSLPFVRNGRVIECKNDISRLLLKMKNLSINTTPMGLKYGFASVYKNQKFA